MKKVYVEPVSSSIQLLAATGMLAGLSGPFTGVKDNNGGGGGFVNAETGR